MTAYVFLGLVVWTLIALWVGLCVGRIIDYADSAPEPASDDTAALDDHPGTWL